MSKSVKVYELAKEFGIKAPEFVKILNDKLGREIKSFAQGMSVEEANEIRGSVMQLLKSEQPKEELKEETVEEKVIKKIQGGEIVHAVSMYKTLGKHGVLFRVVRIAFDSISHKVGEVEVLAEHDNREFANEEFKIQVVKNKIM